MESFVSFKDVIILPVRELHVGAKIVFSTGNQRRVFVVEKDSF